MGLKSSSTVYNHLRRLEEEGRIVSCPQKPRARDAVKGQVSRENDRENLQRRVRIDLTDGGCIFLDYEIEKPKSVPVDIAFCGVLDAKQLKGKVSRVIAFSVKPDEEQEGIK